MNGTLQPAFSERNIPVVFSANEQFAPIFSVMLQSLVENASPDNNYDILMLSRDISVTYWNMLISMVENYPNVSLRLIDVTEWLDGYTFFTENRETITIETYFRLLMPELLVNYEKAIYLDGDMIMNADVAELYQIELEDNLLISSIDCDSIGCYHKADMVLKEYRDQVLKLKDPDGYFCAGMLVMNLDLFRKEFTNKQLLDFAASYQWRQHDQDVLNVLCNGRTKLISPAWNLLRDAGNNKYMPSNLYEEFLAAEKDPKIIHYGGMRKPWLYLDVERGEFFWRYAGKTPFYKQILSMVGAANAARWRGLPTNGVAGVAQSTVKDVALRQFSEGKIGMKYIFKYIKAWFRFKLKRH